MTASSVNPSSPKLSVLPDAAWRARFRRRVRTWYARHARDLPWRKSRDPYRIWVSEIMLQQTQVATVQAYFDRFCHTFPSIGALARADESDVLRQWEGLGYYRRARQLHAAAKVLVREHEGCFPRDPETVRRLPGIGRYTAGAVLSIAFDAREPILEANTLRLFTRLLAYQGDPTRADGNRLLWSMATSVLPRRDVGRFNQALMELGGQVCVPGAPDCHACPIGPLCRAYAKGIAKQLPMKKAATPIESRHEVAVLVKRRGRLLLVRCPEGGRWAGLWDFPRAMVESEELEALRREVVENVRLQTGIEIDLEDHLKRLKHSVTRYRITLDCYRARYLTGPHNPTDIAETRWLRVSELSAYPLNTTARKLSRLPLS